MIFGFWAYAGLTIGSALISWARRRLGPRSERMRPTDFGQLVDPQTQRAGTIPWAYGRVDVGSGVLLVYGGKQAFPLNERGELHETWYENVDTPWSDVLSVEPQQGVAGYRYHLTFAVGICIPAGTETYLRRIRCNGQTIWSGRAAGGSRLRIGGASIDLYGDSSGEFPRFEAASNTIVGLIDHPYKTGDGPVRLIERVGTLGSSLAEGTDYWIIAGPDTIQLATSRADAIAGNEINFGASSADGEFTLTFRELLTFAAGDVNTGTDQITIADHGLATGQLIRFAGSDLPEPIPSQGSQRDWFVIKVSANAIRVARSFTEALEDDYINLTDTGSGTHTLYPQPDTEHILGGPLRGGGIGGVVEFHSGAFDQDASSLLEQMYDDEPDLDPLKLPAHRGMAYAVFGGQDGRGFNMGESPSMHDFAFEIETNCDDLGAGAITTNGDGNPAEFLRQLRVSDTAAFDGWYGLGRPAAEVDDTSYAAAATTLEAEGHTFNAAFALGQNAEQIETDVLHQIGGVVRYNPSTGKLELKLIRDDYVVEDLPVIDESLFSLADLEYSSGTWEETYNAVVLRFSNRALDYTRDAARAHDTATQMGAHDGMPREHEVAYVGVTDRQLATKLAFRDLKDMVRPRSSGMLPCKRAALYREDGTLLLKGDAFVWQCAAYGISEMVMRVDDIHLGTLDDPRIRISCRQDGFTMPEFGFEPPSPPTDVYPTPPQNVTIQGVMEAPRHFAFLRGDLILDIARLYYLAADPGSSAATFHPQVSQNAGVSFASDLLHRPFCAHGVLELDMLRAEEPYDTGSSIQVEDVTAPNGAHASTVIREIVNAAYIRTEGRNLAIVGDPSDPDGHEIVAWEEITQLGTGNYVLGDPWRGLLDTVPRHWPAGTRIWFLGAVKSAILSTLLYDGDESLKVRLVPVHSWLGPMDPEDATQIDVPLATRALRPYPPASFRLTHIGGNLLVGTATNDLLDPDAFYGYLFGGTDDFVQVDENELKVDFLRRDRLSELAARGDDADENPEEATHYDIEGRIEDGDSPTALDDGTAVADDSGLYVGLAPLGYKPTWVDGVDLDSADKFTIAYADQVGMDFITELSVEMWVYFDAVPDTGELWLLAGLDGGSIGAWALTAFENGDATIGVSLGIDYWALETGIDAGGLEAGRWYHIAATFDGAQADPDKIQLYIDGVESSTFTNEGASSIPQDDGDLVIGGSANGVGDGFQGKLQDVRLWSVPKSSVFVARNRYKWQRPAELANLAAWYPLDGDANDYSGNGNDLSATGSPTYVDGVPGLAPDGEIHVYAEHTDSPNLRSQQAPLIRVALPHWRNLLRNFSFDRSEDNDDDDAEHWTDGGAGGGAGDRFSQNGAYAGRCFGPGDDHGSSTVQQVVDVTALSPAAIAGGYMRSTFLVKNADSDANDQVTPSIIARNAANGTIQQYAPGAQTPATTYWTRLVGMTALSAGNFDDLDNIFAGFVSLGNEAGSNSSLVDEVDVRIGDIYDCFNGGPAAACLSNPSYNTNLTSWTTSGTWARATDNLHEGAGNAQCSADGEIYQVGTLPAGYDDEGDTLLVECARRDSAGTEFGQVRIEALDSSDAVLDYAETESESTSTTWEPRRLRLRFPAGTAKIKLRCIANVGAGADVRVDDWQAFIIKGRGRPA